MIVCPYCSCILKDTDYLLFGYFNCTNCFKNVTFEDLKECNADFGTLSFEDLIFLNNQVNEEIDNFYR